MATSSRLGCLLLLGLFALSTLAADAPIDFNRARQLIGRQRGGETLTAEEQSYLERARTERRQQQQRRNASRGGRRPAGRLPDLGADERHEGEEGGLYGGGSNLPPAAHLRAAEKVLAGIRPLDAGGKPADDGRIGFVALSMSSATQEFSRFKQIADVSLLKSSKVNIVDCAQGGQAMAD